jgi:hypothetical protein
VIGEKTVNQKFDFDYGVRFVSGVIFFTYIPLFTLVGNYNFPLLNQ